MKLTGGSAKRSSPSLLMAALLAVGLENKLQCIENETLMEENTCYHVKRKWLVQGEQVPNWGLLDS